MEFQEIQTGLNNGNMYRRQAWDEDTFIFVQVPSTIPASVVPNMTSLSQPVKDEFDRGFLIEGTNKEIYYNRQIAYCNADNLITGWGASPDELLAEDWELYSPV